MKRYSLAIIITIWFMFSTHPGFSAVVLTAGNGSGLKGAHYRPVTVSLENPTDKVKQIQLDVCDADNHLSLNTMLRCGTTSRSAGFSCVASDLPNGCVRIGMASSQVPCPALIAEGSGPVCTIYYDVSSAAPSGQCRALTPQSGAVIDEDGISISSITYGSAGQFCFNSCASAGECNDGKYCNGTETCSGGVCNHTSVPSCTTECNSQCNEITGGYNCYTPAGTSCTGDGLFCNGPEVCNGSGSCIHTGNPCPAGTDCNDTDDVCDCDLTDDCNDGRWCNGEEFCFLGECVYTSNRCTTGYQKICDEANDACVCCVDSQCNDGQWCTGAETCNSGNCTDNADPCSPPLVCDEGMDMCIQPDATVDIQDGSGFIGFPGATVNVRLTNLFDKVSGIEMTLCEENDYLRVPPDPPPPASPSIKCELSSRTTGFECTVGEDINGCTTVVLVDVEGVNDINTGTGTIFTLRLDVKGAGESDTGCLDLNVTDLLVLDNVGLELTSLGTPGEFCIYCLSNANCADTNGFCTGTSIPCTRNSECSAGECNINQAACYIDEQCPTIQNCVAGEFCVPTSHLCSVTGDPCVDDSDCIEGQCEGIAQGCHRDTDCPNLEQTCEGSKTCDLTPNVCTNDSCGTGSLCVHTPNTVSCNDGLYCTKTDRCSGGVCVGTGDPCPTCYWCEEDLDQCEVCTNDCDCDGILDGSDNCYEIENGLFYGTCARNLGGVTVGTGVMCTGDNACAFDAICEKNQEDFNENGIGDVCECYADTNCDTKVDLTDLVKMKQEFNRINCATVPCDADCNADDKVNLNDLVIMKGQFNRMDCAPCP